MDTVDRRIVNALQGGFPISECPYEDAARDLGLTQGELIERLKRLCADGVLSRFGPLYDAEQLGGAVTLAALSVPGERFEAVADLVNAHPEIAHNYARDHALNMWFVIATETPERIRQVIEDIEAETSLTVYNMPKINEFYIGLNLAV
ncbi:MAG: AsnC family transcriptional regulator [Rhodospirillales bacterium]|nr:AsnC family transcriptional regulator [Rhodospirillales bacterium]